MQQKHMTYEDFEQYLDTSEVSEEYLCRIEGIMQHLDECEHCQKILQRMILISSVCDEDSIAGGLDLLKKESVIRRELFALRIEMVEQSKRMQELASRFRAGLLKQMEFFEPKAVKYLKVELENNTVADQSPINVYFDDPKVKVLIYCEEGKEVTVILEPQQENGDLIIKRERARAGYVMLEFDKEEKRSKYTFYIDIQ
jgi:uncharacterized protein (DUF2132 family)